MKKKYHLLMLLALTVVLALNGCTSYSEEELYPDRANCDTANVNYTKSIAPVFAANCNSCHTGNGASGNIRTDSYISVKANISRIRGAVNHQSGFSPMPQNTEKLSDCDLAKIDIWIRKGMPEN